MKTINFQLSSQKCIDEGYVVRPPSPLLDEEDVANPFEIEPMDWFPADHHIEVDDLDMEEDDALFALRDKVSEYATQTIHAFSRTQLHIFILV